MAYRVKNNGGFNVDGSVGESGDNHSSDVMLVQALFRMLYVDFGGETAWGDAEIFLEPPSGDAGPIAVDGIFGPSTRRHVYHFQNQLRMRLSYVDIKQDGLLDPGRFDGLGFGKRSTNGYRYAIEVLNALLASQNTDALNRSVHYHTLPERDYVKPALRSALKTVKTTPSKYMHRAPKPVFPP